MPFFWRKGYSSDRANTPSSLTRPVNDRDHKLLFPTYICIFAHYDIANSNRFHFLIPRVLTILLPVENSSLGAFCFALLCFYVKLGLPPDYYGRHLAWSLTSISFFLLTTVTIFHFPLRAGASCQNDAIMVES